MSAARTTTRPRPNAAGTGRIITVQRSCNGCGRSLGDANSTELDAAMSGAPLPDVRDECGCARRTQTVLDEVAVERTRQDRKWGEQNHPDGTGPDLVLHFGDEAAASSIERWARARTDREHQAGRGTYEQILTEEWAEAIASDDPGKLREELLQVAAVAVAWVEKLDREAEGMYCGCDQ